MSIINQEKYFRQKIRRKRHFYFPPINTQHLPNKKEYDVLCTSHQSIKQERSIPVGALRGGVKTSIDRRRRTREGANIDSTGTFMSKTRNEKEVSVLCQEQFMRASKQASKESYKNLWKGMMTLYRTNSVQFGFAETSVLAHRQRNSTVRLSFVTTVREKI